MWIAFLSALLDPIVVGSALFGVLLVRNAWQLRFSVAAIAAVLSLSELIGGLQGPASKVFVGAAGAAAGGLLVAESARLIVAPIAAGLIALAIYAICGYRNFRKKSAAEPQARDGAKSDAEK